MSRIDKMKPYQIVREIKATGKNVRTSIEGLGRPDASIYGNPQTAFTEAALIKRREKIYIKIGNSQTCREEYIASLLDEEQMGKCDSPFIVLLEDVNTDNIKKSMHLLNKLERKYRWALSRIMPIEAKVRMGRSGYEVYKSKCLYIGSGMWRSTPFHVSALFMLLREFSENSGGRYYKTLTSYMKSASKDAFIKDTVETHPQCIEILIKHATRIKKSVVNQKEADHVFGLFKLCQISKASENIFPKLPQNIQDNIQSKLKSGTYLDTPTYIEIRQSMGPQTANIIALWMETLADNEDSCYKETITTFSNLLKRHKGKIL